LGAIDGTHIPCIPPSEDEDKEKWRNRKGFMSQNVLAAVDFDMNFVYVFAGWEGAGHDNLFLRGAISRGNFDVPSDKYYLADLGYANTRNFITPYRNHPYHLRRFDELPKSRRYRCPEDFYNHKHAQL
jgi:DDE superfamily endonuclease